MVARSNGEFFFLELESIAGISGNGGSSPVISNGECTGSGGGWRKGKFIAADSHDLPRRRCNGSFQQRNLTCPADNRRPIGITADHNIIGISGSDLELGIIIRGWGIDLHTACQGRIDWRRTCAAGQWNQIDRLTECTRTADSLQKVGVIISCSDLGKGVLRIGLAVIDDGINGIGAADFKDINSLGAADGFLRDDNAIFLVLIIKGGEFNGNGICGFLNNIAADGAVKYLVDCAVRVIRFFTGLQQPERSFAIVFIADVESLQALNIADIRFRGIICFVNGYAVTNCAGVVAGNGVIARADRLSFLSRADRAVAQRYSRRPADRDCPAVKTWYGVSIHAVEVGKVRCNCTCSIFYGNICEVRRDFNRQVVLNFNARQSQLVIGIFDFARGIRSARQCAVSFILNGLYA